MRERLKVLGRRLSSYFSNYRHDIYLAITLTFIMIVVFCFTNSHIRIIEAFRDLGTSFGYYFTIGRVEATVNDVSAVDLGDLGIIPQDLEIFKAQILLYGDSLLNWYTWRFYMADLIPLLQTLLQLVLICLLLGVAFVLVLMLLSSGRSSDYDDTNAVKRMQNFTRVFRCTVGAWFREMFDFLKEHKAYYIIWAVTWVYAFNGITIAVEFIAWYLYFSSSLNVASMVIQAYKLLLDLSTVIMFFPIWAWVIIGLVVFNIIRHSIALKKIKDNEKQCEDVVKSFPISSLICGPMGTKKTTFMTDVAITANKLFRQKAYDIIFENDMKFPDMPWQNVEKCVLRGIETHTIFNLASCRKFVRMLQKLNNLPRHCVYDNALRHRYGYDYSNYVFDYPEDCRHEYITVNGVESIWDVLENYVCAFFIYCISTTMLISNYSIRVDDYIKEDGCFPKWDIDFFRRDDQKTAKEHSRYAHILDFDALRLGKIMKANNKMKDSIDFGIVVVTEVGKERGNQLTIKARFATMDDGEATQSNDFMNMDVKLCRHRATVDNFPFVLFLTDENRAASLNADFKGLCDVAYIAKSTDWAINTTLFGLDELIFDFFSKHMKKFYLNVKNRRGGLNLPAYFIKCLYRLVWQHYQTIYRRYSVSTLTLCISSGEDDTQKGSQTYKMSKWKIHNARFTTDALGAFYRYKTGHSRYGIVDIPEYNELRASLTEMKSSHSFLINDLTNAFIGSDKYDDEKKSA